MKSVLISIQPKWCELIASGKKTVEVRKTKPKLETPFKCYIYCTDAKGRAFFTKGENGNYAPARMGNRKIIGEFVCDRIRCEKEVADGLVDIVLGSTSCVSAGELVEYANGNVLYSWHITDLVIYDKPRELREFKRFVDRSKEQRYHEDMLYLQRPPQSWCYVERRE